MWILIIGIIIPISGTKKCELFNALLFQITVRFDRLNAFLRFTIYDHAVGYTFSSLTLSSMENEGKIVAGRNLKSQEFGSR